MGRRIVRSKRIRRYAKVVKIYACESGKKTIQVAKEVKEKTVSFVSKKTSEMWRTLDTEFLFRCATTILICYLSLYAMSHARSREEKSGLKALVAFVLAAFLSVKYEVVPEEYIDGVAKALKKVPTYTAWTRKYARKMAKTYVDPKMLKKIDTFVKMYSLEVKIGLCVLFFVGWWFLSAFVFGTARTNKNKPNSPTNNNNKKEKKKRAKGPIEVNVAVSGELPVAALIAERAVGALGADDQYALVLHPVQQ